MATEKRQYTAPFKAVKYHDNDLGRTTRKFVCYCLEDSEGREFAFKLGKETADFLVDLLNKGAAVDQAQSLQSEPEFEAIHRGGFSYATNPKGTVSIILCGLSAEAAKAIEESFKKRKR